MDQPISEPISDQAISDVAIPPLSECEQILPTSHCNFLRAMSGLTFMCGLYGFYKNQYMLATFPFVVVVTSLNYWRKPNYGWRRNIDIATVITGLSLYLYTSFKTNQQRMYGANICICGGLYGLSWYLYKKGYNWLSTISHGSIYVVLNTANALLYQGLSELATSGFATSGLMVSGRMVSEIVS